MDHVGTHADGSAWPWRSDDRQPDLRGVGWAKPGRVLLGAERGLHASLTTILAAPKFLVAHLGLSGKGERTYAFSVTPLTW